MDDLLWLFGLLVVMALLSAPVALFLSIRNRSRLRTEVERLEAALRSLGAVPPPPPPTAFEAAVETPPPPPPPPPPPTPEPEPAATSEIPRRSGDFEKMLTSRWLVWLGAVVLALAGVFLVKYSIEQGWLSPAVRCFLGLLLGAGLTAAGDWLRRRLPVDPDSPSYVSGALTAAGVTMMYTAVYAAFALYGLVPALVAVAGLVLVSALAFGLSLLHGPLIAALALCGGFLIPALVSTGSESALELFSFLTALIGAALAIVRFRDWRSIAWLTVAGAVIWPMFWVAAYWEPADAPILGMYLLVVSALFLFLRRPTPEPKTLPGERAAAWLALADADRVAWAAAVAMGAVAFVLVRVDAYGVDSLMTLGGLAALVMVAGWRQARFDVLAALALALVLVLLSLWHLERIADPSGNTLGVEGWRYDLGRGPILPPRLLPFATAGGLFAALFAIGGFLALWRAQRPGLWAMVSAAAPVLILAIAFWRIQELKVDIGWALAGLAVAALELLAAERVARQRHERGMAAALGAYAMGTAAAVGFAFAMSLERAWLTVALALLVPAIAAIYQRLPIPGIRRVAWVVAGVVLTRLVLNYRILDYPDDGLPGLGWVLYGYGIPMVAFALAAWQFRRHADDKLVRLLECGALAFGVMLINFEIRELVAGGIAVADYSLLERSLQSLAWLSIAYLLYRRQATTPRFAQLWGWRILAGLAVAQIVFLQVLFGNPMAVATPVGPWPIANLLFLAYGAPALFAIAFRRLARAHEGRESAVVMAISGLSALVLLFVEVSFEVRRAFHSPFLDNGFLNDVWIEVAPTSDAEWYAYSVAWLFYAAVLLAFGIARGIAALRYASLALVMLTVAKLFLFDMSALTGLYRVASFLGLGLSLVGIGYLYQRHVFPPRASPSQAGDT